MLSNDHLVALVQEIMSTPGVHRSRTAISLEQFSSHRTLPLVLDVSGAD